MKRWYVIATYGGRDYRVRDELGKIGIEAWLPECRVRRTARRAIIMIKGPLFPGYLFAQVELTNAVWQQVNAIADVGGFLGCGGKPVPVDDAIMAALRTLIAERGGNVLIEAGHVRRGYTHEQRAPAFAQGQPVRIKDGAYTGFEGVFDAADVQDRIKILLDIFGRRTPVSIPEALVMPA